MRSSHLWLAGSVPEEPGLARGAESAGRQLLRRCCHTTGGTATRLALAPATSGSRPPWRQVMLCVGDMVLTVFLARRLQPLREARHHHYITCMLTEKRNLNHSLCAAHCGACMTRDKVRHVMYRCESSSFDTSNLPSYFVLVVNRRQMRAAVIVTMRRVLTSARTWRRRSPRAAAAAPAPQTPRSAP
jgi:hypothetical protein